MSKNWQKSYPAGVPYTIDQLRFRSLGEMIEECCLLYEENIAVVQDSESLSYRQLGEMSEALSAYLVSELGLNAGDRVALMMPNVLSYPISICGVLRAGCVVVNVNPLYTPRELRHQLRDSGARAIIVAEPYLDTVRAVVGETSVKTVIAAPAPGKPSEGGLADTVLLGTALATAFKPAVRRRAYNDTAVIQYTGGTTGPSKGAELTQSNILSNLEQFWTWTGTAGATGQSDDVVITALPLYHIFAFTVNFLSFLGRGATNVLIANPRDMPGLVATMRRERFTAITGVNTLFNGLLSTPGFADLNFTRLRMTMGGGAAVQAAVARRWQEVTGKVIVEGYGLSETSPILTVNKLNQDEFRSGIGVPLPSTDISIRDEQGEPVAEGEVGELCARGPQVMRGYWNRPDESAKAFTSDGYFRTGDVAMQDQDGHFHIVDRKKDMVLVSGFNVYPNEVEAVCAEHPGVLESACIGVPDEKTGEAVKLFVVRRDPALNEESLINHCRQNMAAYKVPKHVQFLPELPKSPVGKILRRELRNQ